MKTYETIFILAPRKIDDSGEAFIKDVEKNIGELGGHVAHTEKMGRKQFATPIKKQTAGLYWSIVFDLGADKIDPLRELYRLNQSVLRVKVFTYDKPEVTVLGDRSKNSSGSEPTLND